VYVWIWRRLPGGLAGKLAGSLVLLAGVLALLFYVVFPWAEPRLPFNQVTVPHESPAAPGPSAPPG
jgi:hypothetical protein